MPMYYTLWSVDPGNRIRDFGTEDEALAMVRELLAVGWSADDLALAAVREEGDPDGLAEPPTLMGAELAARAAAAATTA